MTKSASLHHHHHLQRENHNPKQGGNNENSSLEKRRWKFMWRIFKEARAETKKRGENEREREMRTIVFQGQISLRKQNSSTLKNWLKKKIFPIVSVSNPLYFSTIAFQLCFPWICCYSSAWIREKNNNNDDHDNNNHNNNNNNSNNNNNNNIMIMMIIIIIIININNKY